MWQAQSDPGRPPPFEIRLSAAGSERRYRVEIEAFEFVTRTESQ